MDYRFQSPLVRTAFALATAIGLAIVLFHADPRALPGSTGTIEHTDLTCLERVGSVFGGCSDSTSCTEELLSPVYYLDSASASTDVAISLAGGPGHGMYVVFTLYVGDELVGTTGPLQRNEAEELRIPSLPAGRTRLRIGARSPEGYGIISWEAVVQLPDSVSLLQVGSDCGVCGNGITEGAEQCDDGNSTDGDGCSSTCESDGGSGIYCCSTAGLCEVVVPGLTTCAAGVMFADSVCEDACGSLPPPPDEQYCCSTERMCKQVVAGEINTCYPGTTTGDPACGDVCSGLPPIPNPLFCCSTAGVCEQVVPGLTTCGEGGVHASPDCGGTCGSPPPPAEQYCCSLDRTCKPVVAGEINTCYPDTTTGDPACGDVCSGLPPLPNLLFCCSTAGVCEEVVPGLTTCNEGVMFAESACGTACREASSQDASSSASISPEDRLVCCSTAGVCERVYPGLTTCKEGVVFRGSCGTACDPPADSDTESYCCEPGVQPDENCRPFLPAAGPACVAGGACDCDSCLENCAPDECPI